MTKNANILTFVINLYVNKVEANQYIPMSNNNCLMTRKKKMKQWEKLGKKKITDSE